MEEEECEEEEEEEEKDIVEFSLPEEVSKTGSHLAFNQKLSAIELYNFISYRFKESSRVCKSNQFFFTEQSDNAILRRFYIRRIG